MLVLLVLKRQKKEHGATPGEGGAADAVQHLQQAAHTLAHVHTNAPYKTSNSYITGPSFVADLLHRKSTRAIARGLLRAINRLQNKGT